MVELDEENSGAPLIDGEEESLTSLQGGLMMGVGGGSEAEYAEIDNTN